MPGSRLQHPLWLTSGVVGAFLLLFAADTMGASATTGPSQNYPPSRYKVASGVQKLYIGQYVLQSAARGARISGGALGVEINNTGSLFGVGQFYGYDKQGFQSSWTATLYNFHETKQRVVSFDLLGPTTTVVLGYVTAVRAASGDLTGTITLPTGSFSIRWRKISPR